MEPCGYVMTKREARHARVLAREYASFARANRRDARLAPESVRAAYAAAEREMVRIALRYRLASRHPEAFVIRDHRLELA